MHKPADSVADQRIAAFIREQGAAILPMRIGDIARACDTSEASVVRYCKHQGFSGLKAFKVSLGADGMIAQDDRIEGDESLPVLRRKILSGGIATLHRSAVTLEDAALEQAVEALAGARNIDVYALGGSVPIGSYLRHQLIKLGVRVSLYSERYTMLYSQAQQGAQDVALAISCSGETPDIVEAIASARQHGAVTLCLTDRPDSTLARLAEIRLITAGEHLLGEEDNTYSRLAQFVVVNLLYAGLRCRHTA